MKKIIILALILCLFTVSCGNTDVPDVPDVSDSDEGVTYNTKELSEKIVADYKLGGGYYYSSFSDKPGEYLDDDTLLGLYGLMGETPDMTQVTEYCVYMDDSDPNLQKEFGIFKLKTDGDKDKLLSFLKARIDAKIENAKNYPSVDTEPLKNAKFVTEGDYVFYVVIKSDAKDIANLIEDSLN